MPIRKRAFVAALVLALVSATGGASISHAASPSARQSLQASSACDGGAGVYLYEHEAYQGRCVRLTGDTPDLSLYSFNNLASSLRVVGEWTATLYVDQNYTGASSTFIQDDNSLVGDIVGNDRASSLTVRQGSAPRVPPENVCDGREGVYLFEHDNFQGRCVKFTGDAADLRPFGFDDTASSIRLLGEWSATLYRDLNYQGTSSNFVREDANLIGDTVGNDQTTSLRVRRGGGPALPQENACDGRNGIYLYEHPQYQGRCVKFTADAPDLRAYGFDDTASSLRVLGSWTVTLYRDLSGTGNSSAFTQDDSNLANDTIGDNQATSLRIQAGGTQGNACGEGDGVYLYEHPNFAGRCVKLADTALDLRAYGFDDTASSVRIVGNWSVVLYRDLSLTGADSSFSSDDSNLANDAIGDNQATSVFVRPGPSVPGSNICDGGEGVYLYEHPQYQGRCVRFAIDASDLRGYYFDDIASSVRIVGNWTVTLARDLSYTGTTSTLTQDDQNLADDAIGDNQATSVRARRR